MKNIIILSVSSLLLMTGCRRAADSGAASAVLPPYLEDFLTFYERFHTDSLFQMEHITFPLEGLPANADSATLAGGDFRWQAEEWSMQHPIDFSKGEFRRELLPFSEDLIIEKITHRSGEYGMMRRFARIGGDEWHLIYYAAPNRLVK